MFADHFFAAAEKAMAAIDRNAVEAMAQRLAEVRERGGGLFLIGVVWSIWLGDRILKRQGIDVSKRWLPLLPGSAGSLFVGFGWWPAIFGL